MTEDIKFITMGELLLRLSPPNYEKIRTTDEFKVTYGGAEANVAASLASFRGHLMYGNCYKIQAELFKKLSFIAEEGIIMKTARRKRYGK